MRPLPTLSEYSEDPRTCEDNPHRCEECPLHKTLCNGCVPSGKRDTSSDNYCLQSGCLSGCNFCGGARGASVPAICCKSDLRHVAWPDLDRWRDDTYRPPWWGGWHSVPPLPLSVSAINVAQFAYPSHDGSSPYEETEAWAVSLRHVRSASKWVSQDLKSYLRIPPHLKLIVLTTMKDDILEKMWDADVVGGDGFREVGIDYWMPLTFSNYTANGQMYNAQMAMRSLEACVAGGAHFIPLNWAKGLYGYRLVLEATAHVQNVVINTQFIRQTHDNWLHKLAEIVRWHLLLPPTVTLSLVGLSQGARIMTVRQMTEGRQVHFLTGTPFLGATRGKGYSVRGEEYKVDESIPKGRLLLQNTKNFHMLCHARIPPMTKEQTAWKAKQQDVVDGLRHHNLLPH